jgi:hypothetical protein
MIMKNHAPFHKTTGHQFYASCQRSLDDILKSDPYVLDGVWIYCAFESPSQIVIDKLRRHKSHRYISGITFKTRTILISEQAPVLLQA